MALSGIGLAGCGRMGAPMLAALLDAGFDARGFDVQIRPALGDFASTDANDFARSLETLLSVVRDIAQTERLLFTDQALVKSAPNLSTIVICSTVSPLYIKQLRQRLPKHIALVDAPMSGAAIAARERRLSFMLGGAAADLARLQPLFTAMGRSFHPMGALGAGMSAKVLNNLLAASNTAMTRLVLDWAAALGLEQGKLLALIGQSSGQNWFASGFDDIEFSHDGYAPDNSIGILKKDVQSALASAPEGADTRLPDLLVDLIGGLAAKSR